MDRSRLDRDDLLRALEELAAVNRRFGGYGPLRRRLARLVSRRRGARILDVGAGDAATLLHLRGWAPPGWRFVGVDLHAQIVRVAGSRTRGVDRASVVRGDALRLPFRDDAFDAALCNLTLHHFGDREAAVLLREMGRVAQRRVLVNDLHRHPLNYVAALLLAATIWRDSPITRHDGPLSVRRSFTPDELRRLGRAGGLESVRVSRHAPFRLLLEGRPPRAAPDAGPSDSGAPPGPGNPRVGGARSRRRP